MFRDERSLLVLSDRECVELLSGSHLGRVAFVEADIPVIIPLNYAVCDGAVVFATSGGTRLADAARCAIFAFEVDGIDLTTRTGWSVVLTGVPENVTDPLAQARIRAAVQPWAPGHFDVFLRLPLTLVTGRRILASAAVRGDPERTDSGSERTDNGTERADCGAQMRFRG